MQSAGDFDHLPDDERAGAEPPIDIDVDLEFGELSGRLPAHGSPIDAAESRRRLPPEKKILGDRELTDARQLLIHHRDPLAERGLRIREIDHASVELDRPLVIGERPARIFISVLLPAPLLPTSP